MPARLGARRGAGIALAVLAAAFAAVFAVVPGVVPGAVATAVADTAPPRAAPSSLAMRAAPAAHGGFTDDLDCSACHTPSGWKLSSVAGESGFDHDRTGFPLRGAHARKACTGCHSAAG